MAPTHGFVPVTPGLVDFHEAFRGGHSYGGRLVRVADASILAAGWAPTAQTPWWHCPHSRRTLASLRCLGYQEPPFLGGSQGLDNIVDVDVSVYVTLTLQVFQRVRDLAPGAVVEPFRLG